MARTPSRVLQDMLGELSIQIAGLTSQVETLREQLVAAQAEIAQLKAPRPDPVEATVARRRGKV